MGIGHILRIFRNHKRINPNAHTSGGSEHFDVDVVFRLFGAVFGDIQVTAVAHGHAQIARGHIVDIARRAEAFHIGAHFFHHIHSGFQIIAVFAIGVFTDIVERQRNLLGGAVEKADAAGFELGRVFGVEHQIPFVGRQRIGAQRFGHLVFIDGQRVDAPEIRHGIFVARINLIHHFQKLGVDIVVVGNQALVDFLISAGLDLAAHVGDRGCHQIIARFAGEHFGFQRFVAIIIIVSHLDIVGFFKFGHGGRVYIIRPVVDIQIAGGRRRGLLRRSGCAAIGCLLGLLAAGAAARCHKQTRQRGNQ